MKKWYVLLILVISISTCLLDAQITYAKPHHKIERKSGHGGYHQPPHHQPMPEEIDYYREQQQLENDARSVIERTAFVLRDAQQAAFRKHYSIGLSRAVDHQEMARELYWQGQYREAIYHSLHARDLAFQIIRANREQCRPGYNWDERETGYRHDAPRDEDLKLQIRWKLHTDKEVIYLNFNWDLD